MTRTLTRQQMVNHDQATAELYDRLDKTIRRQETWLDRMHRAIGDRPRQFGYRTWTMSDSEAMDAARARTATPGNQLSEILAGCDQAGADISDILGAIENLEKLWREHRWSRYFPCNTSNGHIHAVLRSHCTGASMSWATEMSGLPVEIAVHGDAEHKGLGEWLCSHCFPEAPANWCRTRSEVTRAEREAAKAAAQEARYAKRLRPAETFRDHRGDRAETVARCKEILRDEVELRDYYGRGRHHWHAASVRAAAMAAQVLMARELTRPGTGASAAEIARITANAVKRNRKDGARI